MTNAEGKECYDAAIKLGNSKPFTDKATCGRSTAFCLPIPLCVSTSFCFYRVGALVAMRVHMIGGRPDIQAFVHKGMSFDPTQRGTAREMLENAFATHTSIDV